jgi:Protein of unknown function (DUF2934)
MLTDQKIRERAHRLWREAGEPCGRGKEFWRRAREQLSREDLDAARSARCGQMTASASLRCESQNSD